MDRPQPRHLHALPQHDIATRQAELLRETAEIVRRSTYARVQAADAQDRMTLGLVRLAQHVARLEHLANAIDAVKTGRRGE